MNPGRYFGPPRRGPGSSSTSTSQTLTPATDSRSGRSSPTGSQWSQPEFTPTSSVYGGEQATLQSARDSSGRHCGSCTCPNGSQSGTDPRLIHQRSGRLLTDAAIVLRARNMATKTADTRFPILERKTLARDCRFLASQLPDAWISAPYYNPALHSPSERETDEALSKDYAMMVHDLGGKFPHLSAASKYSRSTLGHQELEDYIEEEKAMLE